MGSFIMILKDKAVISVVIKYYENFLIFVFHQLGEFCYLLDIISKIDMIDGFGYACQDNTILYYLHYISNLVLKQVMDF